MSKLDTSPYKGVRDFYPQDQFIENYIFSVWRKTAKSFGYEEYGASILEPTEIYTEKSGEEIVSEQTFTFKDRGDRDVTLRPEMTPTLARMVAARRRELAFPLRWYSVPNLFRYEATQRGRLREHWQLNADLFGVESIEADLELIRMADRIMKNFGANSRDYEIRLNVSSEGDKSDLDRVISALQEEGLTNIRLDPELARGQAYYTGVVFELFDTDESNPRSILGGGRYDNLTELFGDAPLASVGFGAGDVTMRDFLETHDLLPLYRPGTDLYLAVIEERHFPDARRAAESLRDRGVSVAVDWTGRKLGDQIKTADKNQVPFVAILGEDEVSSSRLSLKHLPSGRETKANLDEAAELIKNHEKNNI